MNYYYTDFHNEKTLREISDSYGGEFMMAYNDEYQVGYINTQARKVHETNGFKFSIKTVDFWYALDQLKKYNPFIYALLVIFFCLPFCIFCLYFSRRALAVYRDKRDNASSNTNMEPLINA